MQTIWYVASTLVGVEGNGLDGGVVFGDGVQVAGSDVCPRGVVGGVVDIANIFKWTTTLMGFTYSAP